jgi:hypothetical protein
MTPPALALGRMDGERIIAMEQRIDALLRRQVPDDRFVQSLRSALREWSLAIWSAAETLGPSNFMPDELDRGLELAQRPVFVCGAARSGTTLLRDLLDGHQQVIAIPNESGFYLGVESALFGLRPERHGSYLGCRWIERLAARPPFWLLGSSTSAGSPYVDFARDFAGWCRVPERHHDARTPSWPLAAFALAFGQRLGAGRLPPAARMWIEKTPGNERCIERIWQDFPRAKVIHIVRRPQAVLASVKRMTPRRWSSRRKLTHIFGAMAPSYWIAASGSGRYSDDRYCLIRYEDLTSDPHAVTERLAGFLGIEPSSALLQPTVAGRPATNNTSFTETRPAVDDVLDPVDRALLALAVGHQAAKLGYAREGASAASVHSIVGQLP